MNIIICLDDKNGTMFNHRRQSMDCVVRNKVRSITQDQTVWMNAYSAKQFLNDHSPISHLHVAEDYLNQAEENDYCFVEGAELKDYENRIKKLYIIYWNRVYPADRHFDLDLDNYIIENSEDFVGNSHEKITLTIYKRKGRD